MTHDHHHDHDHDHDHAHAHPHADPDVYVDWKEHGVKVIPGDKLDPNTAQTPGMHREAAINLARVGAQKIWAGTVKIFPTPRPGCTIMARSKASSTSSRAGRACAGARAWNMWPRPARATSSSCRPTSPSGDQRVVRRDAGMRAGAQRQRGGGRQPRHRADREARAGALGRPDPQAGIARGRWPGDHGTVISRSPWSERA